MLVDAASVPHELFGQRRPVSIESLTGSSKPADDDAVALVPVLRRFEHVAFAWPCFWWFEHYRAFARRFLEEFSAAFESDDVRIFRRA